MHVIHVIAQCKICDWSSEDYVSGEKLALNHHNRTGHKVRVEVGSFYDLGDPYESS